MQDAEQERLPALVTMPPFYTHMEKESPWKGYYLKYEEGLVKQCNQLCRPGPHSKYIIP